MNLLTRLRRAKQPSQQSADVPAPAEPQTSDAPPQPEGPAPGDSQAHDAAIVELIESFGRPPDARDVPDSPPAQLFYGHQGRLIHKWPHYFQIYERHLARFRNSTVRLLEIGVSQGGSLQLWRKYFGPGAIIFGVDLDSRCAAVNDPTESVRIGSQTDPAFLNEVVREMGGLDVVIDDGSHVASHQRVTFDTLFPLLAPDGVYIVEDLHASYWPAFEGGTRRAGTFIEEMKLLIDDLHAWYGETEQRVAGAHRLIDAIHFYDSIVVIEKRPKERPFHTRIGTPSFEG